jgi:hypothetical protein
VDKKKRNSGADLRIAALDKNGSYVLMEHAMCPGLKEPEPDLTPATWSASLHLGLW